MTIKAECRVVLSDDSPLDHSFVEGLTTLKEKMDEIDYVFGTKDYIDFLVSCMRDSYLFDISYPSIHKNTPNTLYFMTGYETGSVKFEWLEEILDCYNSGWVKIVLCSMFGLGDEFTEEDLFMSQVMQENLTQDVLGLLHNTTGKIPCTDRGSKLIKAALKNTLDKYHADFGLEFIDNNRCKVEAVNITGKVTF